MTTARVMYRIILMWTDRRDDDGGSIVNGHSFSEPAPGVDKGERKSEIVAEESRFLVGQLKADVTIAHDIISVVTGKKSHYRGRILEQPVRIILGDRLKIRAEACAWGQPIRLDADPYGEKRKTREEENGQRRKGKKGSVKKAIKGMVWLLDFGEISPATERQTHHTSPTSTPKKGCKSESGEGARTDSAQESKYIVTTSKPASSRSRSR